VSERISENAAAAAMPESWRPAEASAAALPDAGTPGAPARSRGAGNGGKGGGPGASAATRVPFHKLFAFADSTDVALMLLGALGAVANGAAMPFMTVLFGNLIDAFGGAMAIHDVVNRVSNVSLEFIYLAIASAVASFVQVTCWMITGERQAARIRNLYLKTILRQEIAFFDKYTSTGEVVGRMSGDTVLIQDAMGEKVGKFIQLVVTFFGGFIVAFAQGWLLTLVMMATIPPLVLAGAVMSNVVAKMASLGQAAYAESSVVVEQTIGSIRTVSAEHGTETNPTPHTSTIVM
jgi:ATP-binding cassette subfamily B (MDR/TAP) protein 1